VEGKKKRSGKDWKQSLPSRKRERDRSILFISFHPPPFLLVEENAGGRRKKRK